MNNTFEAQLSAAKKDRKHLTRLVVRTLLFSVLCVALNVAGSRLCTIFALPMYLDTIGTILAACVGGFLPGMLVGYTSNLIAGLYDSTSSYYGALNVMIGLAAALLAAKDCFRRPLRLPIPVLTFSMLGGGLGAALSWCLAGFAMEERATAPLAWYFVDTGLMRPFPAQLVSGFLIDIQDKLISVLAASVILYILRRWYPRIFTIADLFRSAAREARSRQCRVESMRTKILRLVSTVGMATILMSTLISTVLYRQITIDEHEKLGQGVASLVASIIDANRVEEYLALGDDAAGYAETEERLCAVRDSNPDIEYIYVYQILPDGCHVVFDLDTEDMVGEEPGTVIPFDVSFKDYVPTLLAGGEIPSLITNDTYGWLLTAYQPVLDSQGICRCYAAADISMGQLTAQAVSFLARQISLFLGVFLMILCAGLLSAEYYLVLPVNSIAAAAGNFAYNSEADRVRNLQSIRALDIRTGDEIENLYHAFAKTTEDTMSYIADAQNKAETITKMQNGLILVLAEIVESRDRNTGDHVRKTAMYVRIIVEQMRREGQRPETLTDEYIDLIANAAPLHDIGKIHVPDAVLNKPGRLTDEEFREMKDHTTEGREIITRAIRLVPDSGYLNEARNMAAYHHERWDGKGYPNGLAGEAIPLSARIMAVADVFDALISRRSYKQGFPFEKAMDIIRDGAGTHFDPKVAEAFLHAEPEVRKVSEMFREKYEGEESKENGHG